MPDDKDLEDELLRRFQALKSTPSTLPSQSASTSFRATSDERARIAKEEDDELARIADRRVADPGASLSNEYPKQGDDEDLKRRIKGLRGEDTYAGLDDDGGAGDDAVDAFIAALAGAEVPGADSGPSESRTRRPEASSRSLEREANDVLRLTRRHLAPQESPRTQHEGQGVDEGENDVEDLETEEEIIQRALDETRMNAGSDEERDKSGNKNKDDSEPAGEDGLHDGTGPRGLPVETEHGSSDSAGFSFPSLPTHTPQDDEDVSQEATSKEMEARMALLLGLSGPTSTLGPPRLPSPPKETQRKPGQGWNLPGYKDDNDDDPDSWCCICNKDADVVCLGCDSDPYCESCWMEGHVGERHRTKRYAGKGGQRVVGA